MHCQLAGVEWGGEEETFAEAQDVSEVGASHSSKQRLVWQVVSWSPAALGLAG